METSNSPNPVLITLGCPSGVGPEIIIRQLSHKEYPFPVVVIGDMEVLNRIKTILGLEQTTVTPWHPGSKLPPFHQPGTIYCLPVTRLSPGDYSPGEPSAVTGAASYQYIEKAIELCKGGQAAAMVTAPISKTGLKMAGIDFPGHTEILASKTGTRDYLMMMAGSQLKVTLVTIHVPLAQVSTLLSEDSVFKTIRLTSDGLIRDFGLTRPTLAVCGLNPHAGEGGLFGHEEIEIIQPACHHAKDMGINVTGPLPPDTVFFQARQGHFDAVICMYHDQGLIPFKLIHFRDGVNVTLGLPIVRTSVDHGTAYDIAWRGAADPASLHSALELAWDISQNRQRIK